MDDGIATRRKHPHNDGFVWEDHTGPLGTLTADEATAYDRDGYFVRRGALDPAVLAELTGHIDPLEERIAELTRALGAREGEMQVSRPDEISFADDLAAMNRAVRRFTTSPFLVGTAVDLLGPDVRVYQEHAVYKKPGAPQPFPWHQDAGYEFTIPQHYLTCWIPLTAATVANGCVAVLPGEHRGGALEHWPTRIGFVCDDRGDGGVPVEVAVGDVLVFSSLTIHRSGPNLTAATRKAYIVHYCSDGTRWVDSMEHRGYKSLVCDDPRRQYVVARGGVPVES